MSAEFDLSSRLQGDIVWRVIELSEIVRACKDASAARQEALLRAALPILYAHWEGYFVFAANSYLNFVAEKKKMISVLKDEFCALLIRRSVKHQQINSDQSLFKLLVQARGYQDRAFKKGSFERINGQSNLNSVVLANCCASIAVDGSGYEPYLSFIDNDLINKRNHVAHGASLRFEPSSVEEFRDNVLDLLRITQVAIENAATSGAYLR